MIISKTSEFTIRMSQKEADMIGFGLMDQVVSSAKEMIPVNPGMDYAEFRRYKSPLIDITRDYLTGIGLLDYFMQEVDQTLKPMFKKRGKNVKSNVTYIPNCT